MHTRRAGAALRWTRAALLTVVALLLGVTAHVSADGLLPGPAGLALLSALLLLPTARLLARPASALRIVLLLVVGQASVHVFLTLAAGHRGQHPAASRPAPAPRPAPPSPSVGGRQSLHDQLYAGRPEAPPVRVTIPEPVAHLVSDLGAHAPMAVAHLVAAAGVGLWLAYGERLLWTLLALSTHGCEELVRRLSTAVGSQRAATLATLTLRHRMLLRRRRALLGGWHRNLRPPQVALSATVVRRGPPPALHLTH